MTITKEDIEAALVHLAEAFPQTFVLEKYLPHRPLKVGIAADILARCPALDSARVGHGSDRLRLARDVSARPCRGRGRVDLDGNPAGEVTARDAEYAAAKLAGILASREARRPRRWRLNAPLEITSGRHLRRHRRRLWPQRQQQRS